MLGTEAAPIKMDVITTLLELRGRQSRNKQINECYLNYDGNKQGTVVRG